MTFAVESGSWAVPDEVRPDGMSGGAAIAVDAGQVLVAMGYKPGSASRQRMQAAVEELMPDAAPLFSPSYAFCGHAIREIRGDTIVLGSGASLTSPCLARAMADASELVVAAYTIGGKSEARASSLFEEGKPVAGLILDAIGTVATKNLGKDVVAKIVDWGGRRRLKVVALYRPGRTADCWEEQRGLFRLLSTSSGVVLTEHGVMVPRKSASMFVGLGCHSRSSEPYEECTTCPQSDRCHYREVP